MVGTALELIVPESPLNNRNCRYWHDELNSLGPRVFELLQNFREVIPREKYDVIRKIPHDGALIDDWNIRARGESELFLRRVVRDECDVLSGGSASVDPDGGFGGSSDAGHALSLSILGSDRSASPANLVFCGDCERL